MFLRKERKFIKKRRFEQKDLEARITELRNELRRLQAQVKAGGTIKNPSRIRNLRREIARMLTLQRSKR